MLRFSGPQKAFLGLNMEGIAILKKSDNTPL
jgi:hypothetical protein